MSAFDAQQLVAFVYAEARMLDEQRFEDWLALFTDDGHYWMPLVPGQQDPRLHTSLLYEDKLLLRVRVERLAGARTFSQQPRSRCHHLLQQPMVEQAAQRLPLCRDAPGYAHALRRLGHARSRGAGRRAAHPPEACGSGELRCGLRQHQPVHVSCTLLMNPAR